MTTRLGLVGLAGVLLAATAPAQEAKKGADVDGTIDRGLEWLRRTQQADGHWEVPGGGGQYPTSMTALAGMCLLMEGSTPKEGKYADNIDKAVKWFMQRSQTNGLLGNPNNPTESSRYMYGHGFGLLFLASVFGEEEDGERRKKLEGMLTRAVEFCGKAQTDRGGWGYLSAKEGANFDEGSVTITQLQALRAARNAGIVVPKGVIDKANKYLRDSTTPRGGVIYSLHTGGGTAAAGQERPALTAAAVACAFAAGQYDDEYAKKWIGFCKDNIPFTRNRVQHDEYQSYYFAQAVYVLGDDRYGELFPAQADPKTWLTWGGYKEAMFEHLKAQQNADGSWSSGYIGPVFSTAVNLTILQLDKAVLPIYHR